MGSARHKIAQKDDRGQGRDDLHHEHHRTADHQPRVELLKCLANGRQKDRRVQHAGFRVRERDLVSIFGALVSGAGMHREVLDDRPKSE